MTDFETRPGERRRMRVLIITLSDRASAGAYEDRSGPRVHELLDEFAAAHGLEFVVEQRLLADDAEQLRKEIFRGWEAGNDVIFTTGGTGLGPRDITTDVVAPLCDKLIPGIMEHIRTKFGATNPRARLSRAVAGIMGTTQLYTLPGSVKAVEEYLPEILVTLEHLADVIRGTEAH